MVVDDDTIVRDLCRRMLERMGLSVIMADSGLQAVEWFRNHGDSVHCILIDLTMPEPDGIQTARLLRAVQEKVPIILMSGYSEEEIREQCAPSCFNAFLQKPFSIQSLLDTIKTILG
jgi:two-component system cell cycle sensor histidine kinase/response regulator CckA